MDRFGLKISVTWRLTRSRIRNAGTKLVRLKEINYVMVLEKFGVKLRLVPLSSTILFTENALAAFLLVQDVHSLIS